MNSRPEKRKGKSDIYGTVLAKSWLFMYQFHLQKELCTVFNHVSKSLAEVRVKCKMRF
jgi:hypothetical protein